MELKEFVDRQDAIYSELRNTSKIKEDGLVPNVPVFQGGYFIAFRHSSEITDKVGELSKKISRIVPSVVYDGSNAHTTISDYNVSEDFNADENVLVELSGVVRSVRDYLRIPSINYQEWLFNQNSLVAAGIPLENGFFYDSNLIVECGKKNCIELRYPKMAHITTNRFLIGGKPDGFSDLIRIIEEATPLGVSKPSAIEAGYFLLRSGRLMLTTYERFDLF